MKVKKWLCLALVLCMTVSFAACGSKDGAVYVQSVAQLSGMGGIAPGDRFAGVVVSENVAEINKDGERTITELLVREGDDVKEGQALFSYDTEELQLKLDMQKLELEQLKATIDNFKEQIKDLEKNQKKASADKKLQYTIQIQSTQVELKEAELNTKAKEAEVAKSEDILNNATVTSPVNGRIQSVVENGTDNNGRPLPYITIQQSGSYRIKGSLGELQRGGLFEGSRLTILSRTDSSVSWSGTVTLVDYENPIKNDNRDYIVMGSSDEMLSASKYPFYVELDNTDGLIMGQHVYMEIEGGAGGAGLSIDGSFVVTEEDGSAYVWAEKRGKLEKRAVTVGEYDPMTGTYTILDGLTAEDYIAFPDAERCVQGAATTHDFVPEEAPDGGMMDDGMMEGGMMDDEIVCGGLEMDDMGGETLGCEVE